MEEITDLKPKLHFFICINDRTNIPDNKTPSCGPTITKEALQEIKFWLREKGLVPEVQCTKVLCLGRCNVDGGVLCVYPTGKFIKGLRNTDEIKNVILEEVSKL